MDENEQVTTIAWKDGVLAADKKASSGSTAYKVTKLTRTKTHAIAYAGDLSIGKKFVHWYRSSKRRASERCPLNDSTDALVMDLRTGKCEHWDGGQYAIEVEDRFAALGSGAQVAIGAMAFGASAIEAVECACEWDNETGLGINFAKAKKGTKS